MSVNACGYIWLNAVRWASRPNRTLSMRNIKFSLSNSSPVKELHTSSRFLCLVDGGGGVHKPTPFQQKILVWTKTYASVKDIPERVTRGQMKTAMDKFRVRVSIGMVAMTLICSAIMAYVGRKARNEGRSVARSSLSKREV